MSKPGVLSTYEYRLYNTEHKEVTCTIRREGALKGHIISDIQVDPGDPDKLYIAAYNYSEGVVVKVTLPDANMTTVSTAQFKNPELPGFYYLNETCSKVMLGAPCYRGNKRLYKVLTYGINESPTVDSSTPKNLKDCIDSKSFSKMSEDNLVSVCINEQRVLEATCFGNSSFKKAEVEECETQTVDIKD